MEKCNPMEIMFSRRCTKFAYIVPVGLRELMSDISREVLRCNPKHINTCIADYLDALLITRENARVACKIVENLTESSIIVAQMLLALNITKWQADQAARIIQRAFRKYKKSRSPDDDFFDEQDLTQKIIHRCKITLEQAYQASQIIQRAYRCYRAKLQTDDPCAYIDWKCAASRTLGIFKSLPLQKWEFERAATLIKAAYKGYYTRKVLKDLTQLQAERRAVCSSEESSGKYLDYQTEASEIQMIDYDLIMHQIQEQAAIVIQRAFRAYLIRKKTNMLIAEREHKMVHVFLSTLSQNSEEDSEVSESSGEGEEIKYPSQQTSRNIDVLDFPDELQF